MDSYLIKELFRQDLQDFFPGFPEESLESPIASDEVGLCFLSFFRKLRKKRKILLDPVNPVPKN